MTRPAPQLVAVEIGPFPAPLLEFLLRKTAEAVGLEISPARPRLDPAVAYDERRGQFLAARLLEALHKMDAGSARVVGVTAVDLFNPVLTFVFGEAEMPGRAALFSVHRLRQEFYGLPPDPALLAERAAKEMQHELGHTFGLAHCPDLTCVMSSSHSVEAVDLKSTEMCPACRMHARRDLLPRRAGT